MTVNVIKRDGTKEPLQYEKLHRMVDTACEGLEVSAAHIETNSRLQIYDGITTKQIQDVLVNSAASLITEDQPDYQYASARLLLFSLIKDIFGANSYPHLKYIINKNIFIGLYDPTILEHYTEKEIDQINSFIDHKRDLDFTYAGLSQMIDKYLLQDRSTGQVYETPQFAYMMISATIFKGYPHSNRLKYVKNFYDAISQHYISLPTPILGGVRTPKRGFASCMLIESDDTLASIGATDEAILRYTAHRAGIGIDLSRIRAIASKIRNGEVSHTGVVPFIKKMVATTLSCTQNGIRGGASTIAFPIWHKEIESIIVLKNNKGSDDNRERRADYSIKISQLFYERFINDKNITLFSPHDVPLLNDYFGMPEFDELYIQYENDESIPKKIVNAVELFTSLMNERSDTGRIYILNIDHFNKHSSFNIPLKTSNLCVEISLPTKPLSHIDDPEGRIALCMLSAINMGKFKDNHQGFKSLEKYCDLTVRAIEEIIDMQDYPVKAAENSTKKGRYLGVGVTNLAYYLAKHKLKYDDEGATEICHRFFEAFQYYLLKSSNTLAKERGKCVWFHETKYSKGILPIDTYKKSVDKICKQGYNLDWESLRKDIVEHGLRHSTLSAQMPCESSSVCGNTTNGVDKVRSLMTVKQSRRNSLPVLMPDQDKYKNYYDMLWEQKDNIGFINILSVLQKFIDQSISANLSYNPSLFPENSVPMSTFLEDLLYSYKMGLKTLYYHNTMKDPTSLYIEDSEQNSKSNVKVEEVEDCPSGACKL
jgi:ribonucleoside-diphosphate reductase alpha chain